MTRCKFCNEPCAWVPTRENKYTLCDVGFIPYWEHPNGKNKIIREDGALVSCRLDGDPDKMTGVGRQPHRETCLWVRKFKNKKHNY